MARGPSCGFVDESCGPARALRAVWTSPWTTLTRCRPPRPHSRASRPQAPQDQPPVIRSGCPYRPFDSISASHSNPSQHRLRAGSPTTLQAHFRMGLDWCTENLPLVLAGQPWPETCLRPWLPWSPRAASCHPKGRSEAKEPRSGLTRRQGRRCRRVHRRPSRRTLPAVRLARRSPAQRAVRALLGIEAHPVRDDALGFKAIAQLVQVHRLVLQRPPQPFDEHVVQAPPAATEPWAVRGVAICGRQSTLEGRLPSLSPRSWRFAESVVLPIRCGRRWPSMCRLRSPNRPSRQSTTPWASTPYPEQPARPSTSKCGLTRPLRTS